MKVLMKLEEQKYNIDGRSHMFKCIVIVIK